MGRSDFKIPYTNQRKTPAQRMMYIFLDRSRVCLVMMARRTCGKKEMVVRTAAMYPINASNVIFCYILGSRLF